MRVTIRQKDLKITPVLTRYIEQKVLKPVRRLLKEGISSEPLILDLEFGRTTSHHRKGRVFRAEASLIIGKKMLRAEAEAEDIHASCDLLEAELVREINGFKGKRLAQDRREGRTVKKELRYHPSARFYRKGRILNEGV